MKNLVKKYAVLLLLATALLIISTALTIIRSQPLQTPEYKDGTYEGKTGMDQESYVTTAVISIRNGRITRVDWKIYDSNTKKYFDETYDTVSFIRNNPLYVQQCKENMSGMRTFGPRLIETQDLNRVDGITGATWCYKKFKEVVKLTLQHAVDSVPTQP